MKKYDVQKFELLSNEQIADGIFDMRVKNDELAPLAKCGQFAHVYVPSKTLRRPISVCDSENGVLRLVYQVKGEGTKIMSEMKKGESVDILAPLGNGFKIEKGKRYCLIGGGIGVPPMLYTAKQCENPLVITGFRNKDLIILQDDFKNAGAELVLQHGFAYRLANTQPRVQRAVGILKYQLHPRPNGAQGGPGQVGQLLTVKFHAAGALLVQAKQGPADGGFTAAGGA